jgi:tRNA modification GTPase
MPTYSLDDTIAAISTPVGEGGVGIVRMSGPGAMCILHQLFRPSSAVPSIPSPFQPIPYHLHYGHIADPASGEMADEVLAAYMPAPRTYTRQDVVEINGHGGIVALRRILALCLGQGARLAEPGEFTARAFLNGRIDLAQAEAVLDVVRARTDTSLEAAVGQLAGRLSGQVRSVRALLVDALAYLEASIDFPEDEIPPLDVSRPLGEACRELHRLLAEAERGILYRHGVRTAIVGRPNVGKSSLLNRLLRASRAIVTEFPGTTRDTLEETLNLQGVPVVLVDTAGISTAARDPVEKLGVERSRVALAGAGLALLVVDASEPFGEADRAIAALIGDKPAIVVQNKIDRVGGSPTAPSDLLDARCVALSALTGEGLDRLEDAILETVLGGQVAGSAPVVTSPRHKQALHQALGHTEAARAAWLAGTAPDLVAIDLAAAVNALGEITGQSASEDLVASIFGSFCVGK